MQLYLYTLMFQKLIEQVVAGATLFSFVMYNVPMNKKQVKWKFMKQDLKRKRNKEYVG